MRLREGVVGRVDEVAAALTAAGRVGFPLFRTRYTARISRLVLTHWSAGQAGVSRHYIHGSLASIRHYDDIEGASGRSERIGNLEGGEPCQGIYILVGRDEELVCRNCDCGGSLVDMLTAVDKSPVCDCIRIKSVNCPHSV